MVSVRRPSLHPALRVSVPFSSVLVGVDVSGELSAAQLASGVPAEHHIGIVTITDRPSYHPSTGSAHG